jgi:hypothetical protein
MIGDHEHLIEALQSDEPGNPPSHAPYKDYLMGGIGDEKLVCDVTPAYSLLTSDKLGEMAAISPTTRFIYLLRDPVERLWSHIRMIAMRRDPQKTIRRDQVDGLFDAVAMGDENPIRLRSDYKSAIQKLRAVIDPSRLLFVYFEDLFGGDGLAKICEFLNISHVPPTVERTIHAGKPMKMRDDQWLWARSWLGDQYDYVRTAIANVPPAWQTELQRVQ